MSNQFKILVVDDDELLRETLSAVLTEKKYEVIMAENGQVARQLLLLEDVNFILSDVEMPFFSGIDLLDWVKKNKPTPFMLMTGFSRILETNKATGLGVDDFLPKPFDIDTLFSRLSKYAVTKQIENSEKIDSTIELDSMFCKVPIEDFISEKDMDYEIYVRITSSKYVKIAHQGGKISREKIAAFKAKEVNYLYIKKEDFHKVVGFTLLLSKAMNNVSLPQEKRIRFMKYTGEVVLEQLFMEGINEQSFRTSKDFIVTTIDLITQDIQLNKMVDLLSQHTDYLYSHSVAVSIFSVMIAQELGYQTPQVLFKIALGGLLHDIGKKEIPKEVLEKPRHLHSSEEVRLLESHVKRGKDILENFKNLPSDVVQIVYEHHEDQLGQGYPRGLLGPRIHPLAQIVAVADVFCDYAFSNPSHTQSMTPKGAVTRMLTNRTELLNKSALSGLFRIISNTR